MSRYTASSTCSRVAPSKLRLLGEELAQQAVGVFVQTALPEATRMLKVHLGIGALANEGALGKLFAIVKSQRSACFMVRL